MRFRQSAQGGISTHNRKAHHTTTFFKALSRLAYFFIAVAIISCGSSNSSSPPPPNVAATTQQYVENFYPLWFTYNQSQYVGVNHFVGPDRVSPIYQIVVAINVDTIYASTFASVASQPLIVTIPSTQVTYSALVLDAYGDIFTTKMQSNSPGVYGLTGPGFNGTLPQGVTQVSLPVNFVNVIIRADRFSPTGVDQTNLATQFRDSLMTQTLTDYLANPSGGATLVVPEAFTSVGFKTDADNLIADDPVSFLEQLQVAVGSSNTPPLSKSQKQLVQSFNRIFKNGDFNTNQKSAFVKGTQDAYNAILGSYLDVTGPTKWITFDNIGNWGSDVVLRSAITEFIQYANNHSEAAYYQTFDDSTGTPLDGNQTYVLTFPAGETPEASRFWSLTAYTPDSIELIDNPENTWAVASYTPGLVTNPDGSISIYMSQTLPNGVPMANWLPVSTRPFNVMLRVYGPLGSVLDNTYVPPAVTLVQP